ncbi:MAG: hypothetical protein IME98_05770 [Proteobacteria bacterium]|nr:hypothetical protein [Pseudomonadota bacterium]
MARLCSSCGKALDTVKVPGRGENCQFCNADLKACNNCRFFESSSYNECSEPQAERVTLKDRSNYCDYFEYREDEPPASCPSDPKDPLDKLKGLFKDS